MSYFMPGISKSWSSLFTRCKPHFLANHAYTNHSQQLALNGVSLKYFSSDQSDDPLQPLKRTWNILKSDMKDIVHVLDGVPLDKFADVELELPEHCDILIVGGGVIGSSIAYWLKQRALAGLHVVVLEKDSSVIYSRSNNSNINKYCSASTTLSAGGLRHQFSLPENIQMSMFGAEFLRNINMYLSVNSTENLDVQFTPQGYLFLATEKGAEQLEENTKLQRKYGAKNELLSAKKIKELWPWMNVDSIKLGCHGLENEGWFDPWSLLMAFKNKATALGTKYINGELVSFDFVQRNDIIMQCIPPGEYVGVNSANVKLKNGVTKKISFAHVVIAAGANSGAVGQLCNMGKGPGFLTLPVPVEPRKRYVYCFHCPNGPGRRAPFVIDPTGMYFRREGSGDNYICGMSPAPSEEPPCDNLDVDYNFFDEKIWPILAHRVPAFESLKIKSAWAGYYDYNRFDENAFIGPHPSYINVYLATGFSGHGLQQAPAVGRAMMELIIDGRYVTIDLTRMQFERIFHDEYLFEANIV